MTAPDWMAWMALPPEVHSAQLSSGPGPGAFLAAAGAYQVLSAEYGSAVGELAAVLNAVQGGSWQGPTAEEYVAAHAPYLVWLEQARGKSIAAGLQHQLAAQAYTAALASMPTLAELAANHVVHGVLVATNFFGINTIPIALNEADYFRMWVQAATTMSIYQAVSNVAADSVPATSPAPPLLKADTSDAADPAQLTALASATDAGNQLNLADLVSQLLQAYINYVEQLYAPIIDFLQDPVGNGMQLITDFLTNPSQALVAWGPFLFAVAYQAFSWVGASLTYPQLILDPLLGTILRVVIGVGEQLLVQVPAAAAAGDLAGGAGGSVAPAAYPVAWPAVGVASSVTAPVAAPAASAAASAGTAPAAPAAPAAVTYAVGGFDPDEGFPPALTHNSGAKVPSVGVPAPAAAVSAREQRRARRRRKTTEPQRQYADEFMDMDGDAGNDLREDLPEDVEDLRAAASSRGAGAIGFGGTAAKGNADAAGLVTLPAHSFDDGPASPMLPATWDADGSQART
ncbi:PPE domain-containing protein [Mycobacterium kansasii]|uniref:PPE family protein n=5 Tax=Mycobacterium kansasii TaxID=1768 RepID=U5WU24_MYCKA|nr:PPE family protein [Mycobacterium kansasii]AGZ51426.1 hypothetical protein MKAN_15000 [Mycobacterium kansasii ATCC 12478]ARG56844.1 PPE family protein [Mycobacterium kansasii]ARG62332.1 PPE family protein [Mycobacterium kansasii]ARG69955.1 PPE family protein [Mycobacterium kansasii]ARG75432.1 PPE family protein [Mycobacterium kansasii]